MEVEQATWEQLADLLLYLPTRTLPGLSAKGRVMAAVHICFHSLVISSSRPRRVGWQGIWRPARLRLRLHIHFQQSQKGGLRGDRSLDRPLRLRDVEFDRGAVPAAALHACPSLTSNVPGVAQPGVGASYLDPRADSGWGWTPSSSIAIHRSPKTFVVPLYVSSCEILLVLCTGATSERGGNACSLRISLFVGGRHGADF